MIDIIGIIGIIGIIDIIDIIVPSRNSIEMRGTRYSCWLNK